MASIKTILKREIQPSGTLSSVKSIKIGTYRNPVKFPFITIVPVEERPLGMTNGYINNIRKIRIEVYSHKIKSKSSMRSSMGIIEQIKNLFLVNTDNWLLPDTDGNNLVYDAQMREIESSNRSIPYRNGFISGATLEIDFFSKELFNSKNLNAIASAQNYVQTDSKTLIDTIHKIIKNYKTGSQNFLTSVKSFRNLVLTPTVKYPLIFIGIEEEERGHTYAGKDSVNRLINFYVLHQLTDKEISLERNLNIAELCRDIVILNNEFEGKVYHYEYVGIDYGTLEAAKGILYGSSVRFYFQSLESLGS